MSKDIAVAIVTSTDVTLVAPDAPEESTNYYSSGSKFHDDIPSIQVKHFEEYSPPRVVENRLIIDEGDDGPWVKILQYADAAYKPTAKASGTLTCAFVQNGFAKLSDHEINSLAGNNYYLRFMSQNTKTYLYAHIQDLKFKDEECVFGYGNKKDYGLKVKSNFNAGDDFKYGRHGCASGDKLCLDTETGVTGNNDQRWFADDRGKISADWPARHGVRAFNQGNSTGHARRTQVSIWLKSPIVAAIANGSPISSYVSDEKFSSVPSSSVTVASSPYSGPAFSPPSSSIGPSSSTQKMAAQHVINSLYDAIEKHDDQRALQIIASADGNVNGRRNDKRDGDDKGFYRGFCTGVCCAICCWPCYCFLSPCIVCGPLVRGRYHGVHWFLKFALGWLLYKIGEYSIVKFGDGHVNGFLYIYGVIIYAWTNYIMNFNRETPLNKAAEQGATEVVRKMIAKGADVNLKASGGTTALHVAAANGHTEIVDILLAAGADPNASVKCCGADCTPYFCAACCCSPKTIRPGMEKGRKGFNKCLALTIFYILLIMVFDVPVEVQKVDRGKSCEIDVLSSRVGRDKCLEDGKRDPQNECFGTIA